jgi:hypothetical protein
VKNITVSVDDELYHKARVRAAERRTTLSALVRGFLVSLTEKEDDFERLQRRQNELISLIRAQNPGFSAAERLTRTGVHDRDALR